MAEHYRKADEQDEARQRPGGRPTAETVYAKESDVHSSGRPSGNSQAAYLRRLRKARPDIHQRVLAGGNVVWRDRVVVQLQKSRRSPWRRMTSRPCMIYWENLRHRG
jgi:hypothetical protein